MSNPKTFSSINDINNKVFQRPIPLEKIVTETTITPLTHNVDHKPDKCIDIPTETLHYGILVKFLKWGLNSSKISEYEETKKKILSIKNKSIRKACCRILYENDFDNKKIARPRNNNFIGSKFNIKDINIVHTNNSMFVRAHTVTDYRKKPVFISLTDDAVLKLKFFDVNSNQEEKGLSFVLYNLPEDSDFDLFSLSNDKDIFIVLVAYGMNFNYYYRFIRITDEDAIFEKTISNDIYSDKEDNSKIVSSVSLFLSNLIPSLPKTKRNCYVLITNKFGYPRVFDFNHSALTSINFNNSITENVGKHYECRNTIFYIKGILHVLFFYKDIYVYKVTYNKNVFEFIKKISIDQYFDNNVSPSQTNIMGICSVGSDLAMYLAGVNKILVIDYFTEEPKYIINDAFKDYEKPGEDHQFKIESLSNNQFCYSDGGQIATIIDTKFNKKIVIDNHEKFFDFNLITEQYKGIIFCKVSYQNANPFNASNFFIHQDDDDDDFVSDGEWPAQNNNNNGDEVDQEDDWQ